MDKKFINLVRPEMSTVGYKIDVFPDTQVSITLEVKDIIPENEFVISSRFSNYSDLHTFIAINSVLRDIGVEKVSLFCPYILSSRSDRKFKEGQSFDLKNISKIINDCGFDNVVVFDAHSSVLPGLIDKCRNIPASEAWLDRIPDAANFWNGKTLISPDAGAYTKMFKLADLLSVPLIPGNKTRLKDGSPDVVFAGDVSGKDCVIVDDICDGGRTFEALGGKLKGLGAKSVTLLVTHGIFSKGLILENIDEIYTTNSYRELEPSKTFHVINIF